MAATILLNLAYATLVAATFTRTVVRLRLVLVAAAAGFVAYGLAEGIPAMIAWNTVTGGLHARQLLIRRRQRRSITVTPESEWFRVHVFDELDPFDFHVLWSMGRSTIYENEQLTTAGQAHGRLAVVVDGTIEVRPVDGPVVRIGRGALFGEMSMVSASGATADAFALDRVELHEWNQQDLVTLDTVHPASARALQQAIARDLVAKANARSGR